MNIALKIENGRAVTNAFDNTALARHRWYPIKEGFSANLVTNAFHELGVEGRKGIVGIEPFSGSGTSIVECARLGVHCDAFEVNPFLAFVGQTKLKQVKKDTLYQNRDKVLKCLDKQNKSPLEGVSTFTESKGLNKWLFNRDVLRAFTAGWNGIVDCSLKTRALLRLALLRAVMDNCNAYPDGKCLRYKRLKDYTCFNPKSLKQGFEGYCGIMAEDMEAVPLPQYKANVTCMDVRGLANLRCTHKFDLCVTSPPYLNSFDYSDVYRPEMFLGGFVTSNEDLMKVRMKTLRSHVQASWKAPTCSSFGTMYAKAFNEIAAKKESLWSQRIPEMIQAYFEDMEKLIQALHARANPNALLKIAVATSAYAGVVVPVDLILAEIAELNGWELKEVEVIRRLRSSAQHWKHELTDGDVPALRESVVILRRNKT